MALQRITRDWQALQAEPLPGISAEPLASDLQTWHFNLRGTRGELEGLAVHGLLRFPPRYPAVPPELRLCTPVPHPNVIEEAEGYSVCMDLLEVGKAEPYSGWSSSYCIGSLLLQVQSSLFDEKAGVYHEFSVADALRLAGRYTCSCGHADARPKPAFPTAEDFCRARHSKRISKLPLRRLVPAVPVVAAPAKPINPTRARRAGLPMPVMEVPDVPISKMTTAENKPRADDGENSWSEVLPRRKPKAPPVQPQAEVPGTATSAAAAAALGSTWGIKQLRALPQQELSAAQQRNMRRAQKRRETRQKQASGTTDLEWQAAVGGPVEAPPVVEAPLDIAVTPAGEAPVRARSDIERVPHRLLIECLLFLSAEDTARLALCARFFCSLGEDGLLWRHFFSQCYPSSELTADCMADWKHCFLLEVNHMEADLICYHTKASFQEVVLGIPIDFSVNPRTQRVDYISTTMDFLSVDAFDAGVRQSQWNENIKGVLPLFISLEHFQRARPRFEKAVVQLSPHWRSTRFHPFMVVEVVPKLMNTMVVLLSDKGLAVSDRALDGYFMLWRLLSACVEVYGLKEEVNSRLAAFRAGDRSKEKVPSLGDFLPLISVSGQPASCWMALAQPVLEESFDRNVLWVCRDHPHFAKVENNQLGTGADMGRLMATFESSRVSKRLLMFHAHFLKVVGQQTLDLFFGRPPRHFRQDFKASVKDILAVDHWQGFFAACSRPCPGPVALTDILKQATKNSLRKKYHTATTNFSRIQASGVSHILKKGESYQIANTVQKARLELGSDSSNILCGACLVYEDLTCRQVVSYDNPYGYRDAVKHSGDMMVDGKSKHVIDIDLARVPSSVTRLFLTLCSCGCADLSGFKKPSIIMQDASGTPLCTYNLERAGRAPTVVMAAILRSGGAWKVTAVGQPSSVRCCGNYSQVKKDIAKLRL